MSIWIIIVIVFAAGAVGGLVNALLSHNGFPLPRSVKNGNAKIWMPGLLGNAFIGGIAGAISWGLYGPLAAFDLVKEPGSAGNIPLTLTVTAVFGAMLIGVGGARWLTNEIDKSMLRAAAGHAAGSPPNAAIARTIAISTPEEALRISQTGRR